MLQFALGFFALIMLSGCNEEPNPFPIICAAASPAELSLWATFSSSPDLAPGSSGVLPFQSVWSTSQGDVAAYFPTSSGASIASFFADGTSDSAFTINLTGSGPVLRLSDQSFLIANAGSLSHFSEDGIPDAHYGVDGELALPENFVPQAMALVREDVVLITGPQTEGTASTVTAFYTVSLPAEANHGAILGEYSWTGGGPGNSIQEMLITPVGAVLFGQVISQTDLTLLSLNADGLPNGSYHQTSGTIGARVLPQGVGYLTFSSFAQTGDSSSVLYRYSTNFTLDSTFGTQGTVSVGAVPISDIAVDAQDRILTVGFDSANLYLNRYLENGALDETFGDGGSLIMPGYSVTEISDIRVLRDRSIVISLATTQTQQSASNDGGCVIPVLESSGIGLIRFNDDGGVWFQKE